MTIHTDAQHTYSYRIEQGTTTTADEPTWAVVQYRDGIPQGADAHWVRLRYAQRAMALYERRPELHGQPSSVLREHGLTFDPDAPDPDARYTWQDAGHVTMTESAATLSQDRGGWTSVYDADADVFHVRSPEGQHRTYRRV